MRKIQNNLSRAMAAVFGVMVVAINNRVDLTVNTVQISLNIQLFLFLLGVLFALKIVLAVVSVIIKKEEEITLGGK